MQGLIFKGTPRVLADGITLTGSLVASDAIDTSNDSYVTFAFDYAKGGGATLAQIVVELEVDSAWYPETAADGGTPSGGSVSVEAVEITRTITATGTRIVAVPCYGASRARVKACETGTPGGTLSVTAVASRVGG